MFEQKIRKNASKSIIYFWDHEMGICSLFLTLYQKFKSKSQIQQLKQQAVDIDVSNETFYSLIWQTFSLHRE